VASTGVDVVVPVHGHWDLTRDCLLALRTQTVPHRVIVVDDASPDDTLEHLAVEFPEVAVVLLATNRGFAAACNAGIDAGEGEIVVLVNNDVVAEPRMLELLVAPFGSDLSIGSACPLLLRRDGRIDAFGICADPTMAGFVRYAGFGRERLGEPAPALLGPYGAVAAYRRAALDAVVLPGGKVLDEGIFMYGEELDLALRLSAAGWSTAGVPDSIGVHLGGGSTGRGSRTQRRRAGFGRGYILRAYGVIGGRHALRALVTELLVSVVDAVLYSRDLAAIQGRIAGWRAGRSARRRGRAVPGIDASIGFVTSLRLRIADRNS
jgi:N-acetylglucosaminyl-diphospho-decaprenol L-rhamnosyltransferase